MDGILASKLFSTRQGTIFLGVIAAVIAAIALIVYLNQYRSSVNTTATSPVLTAKGYIEKGTPGKIIAQNGLSLDKPWAKDAIKAGAITDPAALTGQVAVHDIYAGEQLTAADFGPAGNSIAANLDKPQRAVAVPLGSPEQVGGQVTAGSHVDVWLSTSGNNGKSCVVMIMQNAYVLSTGGGNATLQTDARQAGLIIWGSLNGHLWLALRPTVGSTLSKPALICPGAGH